MNRSLNLRSLLRFLMPVVLSGLLLACDSEQSATTAQPAQANAASPAAAPRKQHDPARFVGQALRLLDVSEQQLDGAATLVLSFSVPLEQKQEFADFITLSDLSAKQALEPAWQLSADAMELHLAHLPPRHELNIQVQAGLQAITGVRLQQDHQSKLTTRAMEPMLGFASKGSLLPIELAGGLPVQSLNVSEVDVDFFRIHEAAIPAFVADYDSSTFSVWSNDELQARAQLVYSGRFDLQSRPNVQQRSLLPVREIAALQQPGLYYAVMRQAGNLQYSQPATLFSLSDIGLSVHRSANRLDVFALSIASGKSLPGVNIRLLNKKGQPLDVGNARTAADGHLQLPLPAGAVMLLASHKQQTSFLPLGRSALDLSEFSNLDGERQQPLQLFVFGPRDLYRPGETIVLNALLRDGDGQPLPAQPVKASVLTPDGQELRTFVWQPQEAGFYQYRLPLADSAPTGRWQFVFDLDGSQGQQQVRHDVQVEDFMPERMALELTAAETPLAPQDALDIGVTGRFLYGAPAAGSEVQGQVFVRPLREAVASLPGYQFGSVTEELPRQSLDFDSIITDASGQARLSMASQWDEARSPLELVARVSLMESGGRPITRRQLQAVWPAPQLIGIRGHYRDGQVDEDSSVRFSLLKAASDGSLHPASDLNVRLIRERRDYYWSYSADTGWRSSYSEKSIQQQQQRISLDGQQAHELEFPVQWGSYRLEVEDPATGLISSERFWAGYRWQDSSEDGGVRPDQVRLKLDKPAYRNGELARVSIEAPHAGSGYLLVESADGPLWWQAIEVPEQGLDVSIPLDANWRRHDLYVTALVVRPGERSAEKTAKRAVGVLHLPLDRSQRQLQLELQAAEHSRPSRPLPVRVQVRDEAGNPLTNARVLVSAVDVGVLNITGFTTPDPHKAFFGRKGYGIDQLDVYGQLIDTAAAGLARLRFGGDAALEQGGGRPKSHVEIIAWQSEPLHTDAQGMAELELPLPEFNGQLRLMAQAWTDNRYASNEQLTTVAAPLVAELALPRFLATGDSSQLTLELHNLTEHSQTLQLKLHSDAALRLLHAAPAHLTLTAGERQRLSLPVQATRSGTASIQLEVSGLELPDETLPALQRSWALDVRSPWPMVSRRISRLLQPGEHWSSPANWLDDLHAAGRSARLSLSSQPMAGLETFVRALYDYPYGCSEQTASRLLPLLYLPAPRLSELLGEAVSDEQRQQLLQQGVEHLLSMQRVDGSFAMWNADGEEIPWNSVLATDFLQQAASRGLSVPAKRLDAARERLLRYVREGYLLDNGYSDDPAHSRLATQSYAAYVLAQHQPLPLSALRALHSKAADAKTPLALVHLGLALHQSGDAVRGNELLAQASQRQRPRNLWLQDYGSPLSDQAWQLHALQQHGQLSPAALDQRLQALLDAAHGQRWLSTQENAALFMALHSLGLDSQASWQASLNEQPLSPTQPAINLSNRQLQQPLHLHNNSDVPLYQLLSLRGEPLQHQPLPNRVLKVERSVFNLDGTPAKLDQLDSGSLLLVRLQLQASESVRDALVVDLLPAGFELENQNLANGSVMLDEVAAFAPLRQSMSEASIAMQGFLDDRYIAALEVGPGQPVQLAYLVRAVTPGSYQLPPVQVQSMYRPDWQASHASPAGVHIRAR